MTRLRRPYPLLLVLLLAACTAGDPAANPAPSPSPTGVRVEASVDIGGGEAYGLAVSADAVWAVSYQTGALTRIDPATNAARPVRLDGRAAVLLAAGGTLWVSSDTTPLRAIDPATGRVARTVDAGGGVPFLARDGLVWGAAPALIWAVDARTGEVTRRIPIADSIEVLSLELAGDAIWVGIRRPGRIGAVLRLDAATGELRDELREITIPARMAYGFGALWVTESGGSTVHRIATDS